MILPILLLSVKKCDLYDLPLCKHPLCKHLRCGTMFFESPTHATSVVPRLYLSADRYALARLKVRLCLTIISYWGSASYFKDL